MNSELGPPKSVWHRVANVRKGSALRASILAFALLASAFAVFAPSSGATPSDRTHYTYGGVWLDILKQPPPTVEVGKTYPIKVKYTNRYRNRRDHYKHQRVKIIPWVEWGSHSYPSKTAAEYSGYSHSTKGKLKLRKLEYGDSWTVKYRISFNACLPPWGPDWGGKPGDFIYSGLPCASGRFLLKTTAVSKGGHWSGGFAYPFERNVFIVPSGPTGAAGPSGT